MTDKDKLQENDQDAVFEEDANVIILKEVTIGYGEGDTSWFINKP